LLSGLHLARAETAARFDDEHMTKILLTGGAGFIGSHVVERLIASGWHVVNLDLLTYAGNLGNLAAVADHDRYTFVHGNIGDSALVSRLLAEHRPGVVFNIAAESHVDRSIDNADEFIDTNVGGVHRLLSSVLAHWRGLAGTERDVFRFIQMSTDEVYGSIAEGEFTETSNYQPNSPYAASKAAGDHFVRAFRVTFGLPTLIARASNTYGPRQFPEKLIPHMIISALSGRTLPVYGQGLNVRDWMHVEDLARGLEQVVKSGQAGEVYNFAGRDEWRNIDTVQALCRHLDVRSPLSDGSYNGRIAFVNDRPGHDLRYAMAIDKVRRTFGWQPAMSFEEGLPSTIDWYLANRPWWQAIIDRGYQGRRIGIGRS
jgi:dTDP-glucose 4,6-dehydratase